MKNTRSYEHIVISYIHKSYTWMDTYYDELLSKIS